MATRNASWVIKEPEGTLEVCLASDYRRLETQRDALASALETAITAMRAPLDGWKGEVERVALDKARAALAALDKS